MTLRAKIALPLAAIHLALVAICFGAAIVRPERSALAPVIVLLADMPASLSFKPLRTALDASRHSYVAGLLIDATIFAVFGTLWWYIIGVVLAWLLSTMFHRT